MSYEPQNLQELAQSIADFVYRAPNSNTHASIKLAVLVALRRARELAPDPVND